MFVFHYALPAFIVLILGLQGYKWYRIHKLASSREPTPPSFWKVILLPWAALFAQRSRFHNAIRGFDTIG